VSEEQSGTSIPQALGSLFFISYYSQGYGRGILNRLHPGLQEFLLTGPVYNISALTGLTISILIILCSLFAVEAYFFVEPVLSNGSCIGAYFAVVA
jgi:hypothetical protein